MIDMTNTMYKELNISEQQIESGQVIDAQEHLEKLKSKYGLSEQYYLNVSEYRFCRRKGN